MAKQGTARRKARPKKAASKSAKGSRAGRTKVQINPKLLTYYRGLAVNKPESLKRGAAAIAALLAVDPKDPWANAEEAHRLVNEWRNGAAVTDLPGLFAKAHYHAQLSITVGSTHADPKARPYGFWAEGFVYKYERQPALSAQNYLRASLYNRNKFRALAGRRRRALMVEILESQLYWAASQDLAGVIELIQQEINDAGGSGERETWFQWVKCFSLHLAQRFDESNTVFMNELSNADKDVSLIVAANYARLGDETKRQAHRDRFKGKDGNANWSATIEDERSPFTDAAVRAFWKKSVTLALA